MGGERGGGGSGGGGQKNEPKNRNTMFNVRGGGGGVGGLGDSKTNQMSEIPCPMSRVK